MKKVIQLFLIFILVQSGFVFAQFVDYSKLQSVVKPPLNYNPLSTLSSIITVDGFDNFFVSGNDFGEPYIAVNPNDPRNIVCAYNINNFHYTLNGIDWFNSSATFSGFQAPIGDPVMAYDSLGNLYYIQLYQRSTGPYGVAIGKSTNKGVNWVQFSSAYETSAGLCDKEWITSDQTAGPFSNYVYVGWRQFGASGMRFSRSTDFGATWSTPTPLTGDQGAYLVVGPNGNTSGGYLYFGCSYSNGVRLYRSSDGGLSFPFNTQAISGITGPGVICYGRYTMKNCIRTDIFPRMAADNSWTSTRGNVYVVWAANPNSGPDLADVYFSRSTDYGVTWSTKVRVNDDITTTDQWMPAITCDRKTGKIFIYWYDSRVDPVGNLTTEMWGTTSTNGGVSFAPNARVSNASFNPNLMATGQGTGQANYMGDYIGNSGYGSTSMNAWMDSRTGVNGTLGSYTGYFPDFAFNLNPGSKSLSNNDSTVITLKIPAIKGNYTDRVKFTQSIDTLPASGSIQFSYVNGKDSITAFPDSVYLKVKTVGTVTPRLYRLFILGTGINGLAIHKRTFDLYVNASSVTVQTNREFIDTFKVNGVIYNSRQQFVFPNGSTITVQAVSPNVSGNNRYIFRNWSDAGDTTHNVTISGPLTLTAFYKIQYKLIIMSTIPFTIGGNDFYDSAVAFQFGVTHRIVSYNGQQYTFRGWDGYGNGSYTSADSTGNDTLVTISMINTLVEVPRWVNTTSIQNIGASIPKEYKLYQNYPNPFNPTTTVNFDIIKTGNVKIIIYDALGREIKMLVNETAMPGSYKAVFDAHNISSGVYFYKIVTNDFTDIKKMLIIK